MGIVIDFKPKDQIEFEKKLAQLKEMFELVRQQKASTKCNWVFLTRDNFMKIISGSLDAPRLYRLPKLKQLSWRASDLDSSIPSDHEYLEF